MYLSPTRPKTKLQINAANLDGKIAQRDERKQRIIAVADSTSNHTKQINFASTVYSKICASSLRNYDEPITTRAPSLPKTPGSCGLGL